MPHSNDILNGSGSNYQIPPHLIGEIARQLRGEPNKEGSTENDWRFGKHGSLSVNVQKGIFFDHEAKTGGGILDLIERETGAKDGERWEKLAELTGFRIEHNPAPNARANASGNPRKRVVATYSYQLDDGHEHFQVVRYDPKEFRQRHADGMGGWVWRLPLRLRHLPYRLPELREAIALGHPVLIVEGEKDADAARHKLGIAATCNAGGAGKWTVDHAAYLKDADVIIIPDNDGAGCKHAEQVARSLMLHAARVRILTLPELSPKGDLSEWISAGGSAEQLWELIEAVPDWTPSDPARNDGATGSVATKSDDGGTEDNATETQGSFVLVRRKHGDRQPGVYFIDKDDEGNPTWLWTCSLLEPLAKIRDNSNRNWGRLLEIVDDDGVRHVWSMPAKLGPTVGDGVDFRRELVERGLEIASGSKARARLNDYVTTWRPSRKVRCVTTVGWCGDAFVMPDRTYGGAESIVMQVEGTAPEFAIAGSLDGWMHEIASLCPGNSRLVFGVSAAFSGPLVKLAGEESGGVHFLGDSSIGKTTMLHVARSVWGTPLGSWRTTDNNAEAIAAGASDALVTLDEVSQAHPRVVGELAYMLGNGRGKGRLKRDATARQVHRWRIVFLSTGEVGISGRLTEGGDKARAGQKVRVLEIRADAGSGLGVFENLHGFKSAATFAEHFRLAADLNCGHAARKFLAFITNDVGALASAISVVRAEFIAKHCPPGADGQVRRACGRFAVVGIAGELATKAGITGWHEGEATNAAVRLFQDWLEQRGGAGAAETREAFERVRLFLEQHGEARFAPAWDRAVMVIGCDSQEEKPKTDRPTINRAGFRKVSNEGTTFYVLPEVWRSEVCKGLDPRSVATAMAGRGWLLRDAAHLTRRERIPGEGNLRVFVIPPAFLSGSDEK